LPHCIVEYSPCVDAQELNNKVFKGALDSGLFASDGSDIKVRSIVYGHYQTGAVKEDFIHVTLRILSGRNDADKLSLSQSVLSQLESLCLAQASLTVEVVDMDRDSYSKKLV